MNINVKAKIAIMNLQFVNAYNNTIVIPVTEIKDAADRFIQRVLAKRELSKLSGHYKSRK